MIRPSLVASIATVVCLAHASGAAADTLQVYGLTGFQHQTSIASGQILSPRKSCSRERRFKLVATSSEGKPKVLDRGMSSREGAVSGYFRSRELDGADDAVFIASQAKGCPRLRGSIREWSGPKERTARAAEEQIKSFVAIVAPTGVGADGAFKGIVALSPGADCFRGRRMTLLADGEVLDQGDTTKNGAWALHLTQSEFDTTKRFRVKVAGARTKVDQECTSASALYPGGVSEG